MSNSEFPWDSLKAETLRLVSRDLGYKQFLRRDDLIAFFRSVGEEGLEAALETHNTSESNEDAPETVSAPVKRKSSRLAVEEPSEYNTRFRATKRGRLSDVGPRMKPTTKPKAAASDAVKRPRGRPRKIVPVPADEDDVDADKSPAGKKKEVFDGVVLPPRSRRTSHRGKGVDGEDIKDADGSVDDGFEGSNKENESLSETGHLAISSDPTEGEDADAEGKAEVTGEGYVTL